MNTATASISTLHQTAPSTTRTGRDDLTAVPAAIRSEWIKLRSLRSTPAILAATVVIGVLLSWILATFVKTDPNTDEAFTISQTFIFSTWLTTMLAVDRRHVDVHLRGATRHPPERRHGPARPLGHRHRQGGRGVRLRAGDGHRRHDGGFAGAVLGGLDTGDTSGVAATVLGACSSPRWRHCSGSASA